MVNRSVSCGCASGPRPTGHFTLILGPMFAGKTSELLRLIETRARCDLPVLLVRHLSDRRGSPGSPLFVHRGDELDRALAKYVRVVQVGRLRDVEPEDRETFIAVDEGQFFDDLADAAARWAGAGRTVVASALSGKADRTPWSSVSAAVPEADEIVLLKAVCQSCRRPDHPAGFSSRRADAPPPDVDGKAVGAGEAYLAVCRECAPRRPEPAEGGAGGAAAD